MICVTSTVHQLHEEEEELLFNDLLLRSYLYHCVWSTITGCTVLQTAVIDDYHKHVCIYDFAR